MSAELDDGGDADRARALTLMREWEDVDGPFRPELSEARGVQEVGDLPSRMNGQHEK